MSDLDGASRAPLDTSPARLRAIAARIDNSDGSGFTVLIRSLLLAWAEEQEQRGHDGIIRGKDAERIQDEIRHGTPNTPKRIETMRRADEIYRKQSVAQRKEEG